MRWLLFGMVLPLLACGESGGGDDDDDEPGEELTGVFLFRANARGNTEMQGQVAVRGAIGVREPEFGCSHPTPEEPWALADFLAYGDENLRDIGDIALRFPDGGVLARFDRPPYYQILDGMDVEYPAPGSQVSLRADDNRFQASLTIGEPPVLLSPPDGHTFIRTEDMLLQIQAGGATGIVVDFDFPDDARLLCFFREGGDITIAAEDIADGTFGLSGPTNLLVGTWTVGTGGTEGVDVHLVSSSTTAISMTLQKS